MPPNHHPRRRNHHPNTRRSDNPRPRPRAGRDSPLLPSSLDDQPTNMNLWHQRSLPSQSLRGLVGHGMILLRRCRLKQIRNINRFRRKDSQTSSLALHTEEFRRRIRYKDHRKVGIPGRRRSFCQVIQDSACLPRNHNSDNISCSNHRSNSSTSSRRHKSTGNRLMSLFSIPNPRLHRLRISWATI